MTLLSVGVDHDHVDLDLLEQLTIPEDRVAKTLRALLDSGEVTEAVVLSTCLRTEVYATVERFHGAVDAITAILARATGVDEAAFRDRLTIHFDRGVAGHLFAVAAGLCSAVPGEYEVLGQVRRALECAEGESTAGAEISELFHRALAAGRHARHETGIARGATSFASAAVAVARDELGGSLTGARAVVIGAGDLARGVARALVDQSGVETITIANRTVARALALADELTDDRVRGVGLDELPHVVAEATVVIAALTAPSPVLTGAALAGRDTPLLVMDLGVPRVLTADIGLVPGVRRLDLGDLRAVVDRALEDRREAVDAARVVVDREADRYLDDRRSRGAAEIVRELRDHLEALRVQEVTRRRSDVVVDDATWEQVEALTRSIIAKIAHEPTVALKEASGTDRGHRLTDATRTLFDL